MPAKDTKDLMLETVLERDMDLLFLEELTVSEEFQKYIYTLTIGRKTGVDWGLIAEVKPKHSVSFLLKKVDESFETCYEFRETDIEVTFITVEGEEQVLFLENKVDAAFTEKQPESYSARVDQAAQNGIQAASLLVAPNQYIQAKSVESFFDFILTYEELELYFDSRQKQCKGDSEMEKRFRFKKNLISHAFKRYKRSGPVCVNQGVTCFREVYDKRVINSAPELQHKPIGKIGTDIWITYSRGLENNEDGNRYVIHKVDKGKVDLHVKMPDLYKRWNEIYSALENIIDDDMSLPNPNKKDKSFKISIDVPVLNPYRAFTEKETSKADKCIEALVKLHRWHNEHKEILSSMDKEFSRS